MLLLDFPAEILVDICEHLLPSECPYCDNLYGLDPYTQGLVALSASVADAGNYRKRLLDLSHLCGVSKVLRTIATPVLYHLFVDILNDEDTTHGWSNKNLFLRTLDERPELCNQVRRMHFHWLPSAHPPTGSKADIGIMMRLAERVDCTLSPDFVKKPYTEIENLFSDLLFALCPEVEDIVLGVCDYGWGAHILNQRPFANERLRSITFVGPAGGSVIDDPEMYQDLNGLSKIAPNLSRLSAVSCPWVDFTGENITVLDLTECVVSAKRLESMVLACRALEKFNYESGVEFHATTQVQNFPETTPRGAAAALSKHKDSLSFLQLDFTSRNSHAAWGVDFPIPTLRDFTALRTLRVNGLCIYNEWDRTSYIGAGNRLVDFLPPQIELFMVIHAHEHLFGDAENLIRQIPQHFQKLEEFGFAMNIAEDNWHNDKRNGLQKALQKACKEIGVVFRYREKCFSWERL